MLFGMILDKMLKKKFYFNGIFLLFFFPDVRWKNKFWGKSMEILPIGSVNLMIPR